MSDNNKIIQNISLLYELSLAFGQSLDLKENCQHFLKALMTRKSLNYAAVWIHKGQLEKLETDELNLVYANPSREADDKVMTEDHYIWQELKTRNHLVVDGIKPAFQKCIQELTIERGAYVFYRLGDIGFLKLHTNTPQYFHATEINQLVNVVNKFALFLNGCIAHQREKKETAERLKIQDALFQSEEKYRTVVHSLSEGIIITDLDGRVTFVNERMLELTGFERSELMGEKAHELLVAPSESSAVASKIKQRNKGVSESYFIEHVHKNGNRWMGRIKGSPYRNAKGEIVGTMGVVNDISAQREVERRIVESEQKLRKIINTSLDAVVTINEEGLITEWNTQAEHIFGYSREEALDQPMGDLIVPKQHRKAHNMGMKHFLKTGEGPVLNKRIEIIGLDKSGRIFPIELSISPMKLGGKYIFSGFIRDITERKKAEEELIAAKQAAEQARMAEHQFLTNMSHEIRTPMNAVIGMTHLLYETNPNDSQKEYLDSLLFSADSLMGIINNILDLAKIEAGELEFEKRTFNLQELLKGLQQTFQFKVRDKAVSVVVDMDPKIENHLLGDSVRLNQILTNLLGNASKFTKRGTIGIRTKLVAASGKQCILQFQVHDTGIGIDQESLEVIFQSFKQADVGITRKFGGSGLGLAIVKQMVEMQGGSIEVESKYGEGSVFSVVLPFENSGIKLSEVAVIDQLDDQYNDVLKSSHILVVEDNFMNQKLISKIMDLWECNYTIASGGAEAIELTTKEKYDLILMDIHMPEMDGCETTHAIRSDDQNLNFQIPIIALTAAALLDEKNRAFDSGMNDFLTKPFSPERLKQMILKWRIDGAPTKQPSFPSLISKTGVLEIDLTYLREMSKGDDVFIKDMIEIFLTDIPKAIEQLYAACKAKEWQQVCDIAHRIKSNFMMLGMTTQQDIAFNIEKNIKEKKIEPEQILKMVHQLKNDTKMACPLLEQERANLASTLS